MIYYPACTISIGMRFDAALHISNSRQALSAGAVRRNSPPLTAGEINKLLAGQPIGKAPQIQAAGPDTIDQIPISSPLFVSSPSDELSWLTNVVPRSVSVRKPGYRRAGEAHITIGFHELPIDPILLKAMQVRIFFGTVSPDDAASGFTSLALDGSRRSVLRTYNAAGEPDLAKLAFWGIVDDMEVDWGTDSTITITARDLRSIFLDSPLTKGTLAKIKLDRPITDVIQQLVDAHPLAGKMQIKVQPSDWNGPIPSPCVKGNLTRENLGAKKGSKAKIDPASVLSKLKWWDAIIQYCQPADALVWREDLSWARIDSIKVGDRLIGFERKTFDPAKRQQHRVYTPTVVEAISRRMASVVKLHMASGRTVRCTGDHHWFTGRDEHDFEFLPPKVNRPLIRFHDTPALPFEPDIDYKFGYARGLIDGDGAFIDKIYEYAGKKARVKHITVAMYDNNSLTRLETYCRELGLNPRRGMRKNHPGYTPEEYPVIRLCTQKAIDLLIHTDEPLTRNYNRGWLAGMFDAEGCLSTCGFNIAQSRTVNPLKYRKLGERLELFGFNCAADPMVHRFRGGIDEVLRFFQLVQPAAVFKFQRHLFGMRIPGRKGPAADRVVKIEECGVEEVISMQTSTHTYVGQGYASRNCYLVGAVPFFRGPDLFIRPAKSLYDLQAAGLSVNNQTPFAGGRRRIDAGGNSFGIRKMIYGHNVKSLKFKRKYTGGERPRIVEVISVNMEAEARDQQLLTVYWPEDLANRLKRQHVTKESPSGQLSENEVWRISFHGIKDKAQLRKIAEAIFETTARYEVTGSFDTSELSSFVGRVDGGSTQLAGNADPDLLHLEPGDAVEFSVSPSNLGTRRAGEEPIVSELNRLAAMSFEEAVEYVDRRVRDKNIARAIVATYRQNIAETQSTYRINEVSYNWDGGKIRITGEFHNYIEVADGVYSNTAAANAQFSTISADQILKTKTVPASPTAGDAAIQQLSILDTEDI